MITRLHSGSTASPSRNGRNAVMDATTERILIQQGDITEMDVDAIVNAANNDLILRAGVAGAIGRKGGPAVQDQCNQIGSIPLGYAAITRGGNLKARYVIHAASMGLAGEQTTAKSLRTSTAHSLRLAKEKKLKTIAFPAVGTGVSGFPVDECAEIMLGEAIQHLQGNTSILTIYFVLYDPATWDTFRRTWEKLKQELPTGAAGA
jgi:O-acetyl-ADP-ribose deacetylase (regulator of RNase III)